MRLKHPLTSLCCSPENSEEVALREQEAAKWNRRNLCMHGGWEGHLNIARHKSCKRQALDPVFQDRKKWWSESWASYAPGSTVISR